MKLHVLATGSSGNASIVEGENENLAIDFGLSYSKWEKLVSKNNLDMPNEFFITHEHTDHLNQSGLNRLLKVNPNIYFHTNRGVFETDEFTVQAFLVPHDIENHGLVIQHKPTDEKLVYITDCSAMYQTAKSYKELLTNADIYALEANYDEQFMENPDVLEQMQYKYNIFKGMGRHTSKQEALKTFAMLKKPTSSFTPLHKSSRFYQF